MAGTSPAMTGKETRLSLVRPSEQMVGDDAQLDLGSALEDLRQPGVAPIALDRARGGMGARLLQPLRHGVERAAFLADQAFAGHPAIVERELERLPAEITDLRNRIALAAFRQRTPRLFDQEGAQAEMPAAIV